MKQLLTALLLLTTLAVTAQKVVRLEEVFSDVVVKKGHAIIYGNFIQRLGVNSFGFGQEIRLLSTDTNQVMKFVVKQTFKSRKEQPFTYFIKPGNYVILNYLWTKSKWYGGYVTAEPIFKGIDTSDHISEKINSGQLKEIDLELYGFTITENSLNYLGTWHFDTGLVSFTDDKETLDKWIIPKYKKLDFAISTAVLTN